MQRIHNLHRQLVRAAPAAAVVEQTGGPRRRVIAAQAGTTLACIGPDMEVEWSQPIGQCHDLFLLPNGNILTQDGWTHVVEYNPDRSAIVCEPAHAHSLPKPLLTRLTQSHSRVFVCTTVRAPCSMACITADHHQTSPASASSSSASSLQPAAPAADNSSVRCSCRGLGRIGGRPGAQGALSTHSYGVHLPAGYTNGSTLTPSGPAARLRGWAGAAVLGCARLSSRVAVCCLRSHSNSHVNTTRLGLQVEIHGFQRLPDGATLVCIPSHFHCLSLTFALPFHCLSLTLALSFHCFKQVVETSSDGYDCRLLEVEQDGTVRLQVRRHQPTTAAAYQLETLWNYGGDVWVCWEVLRERCGASQLPVR